MNRPPSGGRAKRKVGERSDPRENPLPLPPLLSPAFFALSPRESLFTGYRAGGRGFESPPDQHSGSLGNLGRRSRKCCLWYDICNWLGCHVAWMTTSKWRSRLQFGDVKEQLRTINELAMTTLSTSVWKVWRDF